mgnify:FL=1
MCGEAKGNYLMIILTGKTPKSSLLPPPNSIPYNQGKTGVFFVLPLLVAMTSELSASKPHPILTVHAVHDTYILCTG